ncbi:DUF1877 family protein [Streptomyces flaveolus]|uniref:DUF1877 family protein n=1 Tax=Streptomyces flaveolus TaxID=67297 RepID=A0ABV1VB99_9ACTN
MSMNGEYLRVTPAELDRALKDPDWALDLAEAIQDAQEEQESAPHEARHFTTHKTWDLLGFLLRRSAFPVDIVHGEELLASPGDSRRAAARSVVVGRAGGQYCGRSKGCGTPGGWCGRRPGASLGGWWSVRLSRAGRMVSRRGLRKDAPSSVDSD